MPFPESINFAWSDQASKDTLFGEHVDETLRELGTIAEHPPGDLLRGSFRCRHCPHPARVVSRETSRVVVPVDRSGAAREAADTKRPPG
ncbi:hypothetical protein GCM10027174_11390 [Salinifilum aidingensis]